MNETKVSVIILSYNTKQLLRECLKSLQLSIINYQLSIEVIVVDNGSSDGSVEMVREMIKSITGIRGTTPLCPERSRRASEGQAGTTRIKLIENKDNLGFAKGNNQALRYAQGKLLFFLNSDTIVKGGAIGKLVDYLERHLESAAVSPLLLNEDGSIQKDPCYLKFPSPLFVFIYYNRILKFIADNLFPGLIYSTQNFSSPNEVDQLPGAALMIRKDVFEKFGGFEENFPHFFEDVDLSYRLRQSGHKLYLVPEAKIVHFGRKSLESKVKKEGIESLYYLNFKALFRFCQGNLSLLSTITIMMLVYVHLLLEMRLSLIKKLVLNQSE